MLTAAPRGAERECRPGQRNGPPTEQRNLERRNGDDAYENSLTPRAPYKLGLVNTSITDAALEDICMKEWRMMDGRGVPPGPASGVRTHLSEEFMRALT